jgi:hypothetical protein
MDINSLWEEHTRDEFVTRDVEGTLATMSEDAYVNHIPVMTGGYGKEELRRFYSEDFIPRMPPDTSLVPIFRTVGKDQLVDEMIFSFTHTGDAVDVAGGSSYQQAGRDTFDGDRSVPRWKACARTHLFGPGLRSEADRLAHRRISAGVWC